MQHPTVNLNLIKKVSLLQDDFFTTESPTLSNRKKKSKGYSGRKNNQSMIQQSYDLLMNYVDKVDERVQEIIKTYEAEFLQAYQMHIKKVRGDMDDLKKKAVSNNNSQQAYLKKIDLLEKQLVLFREESLKLFSKMADKDKSIQSLNMKIQQLNNDNKYYETRVKALSKKNKQLQIQIAQFQGKNRQDSSDINKDFKRQCYSQNKMREILLASSQQQTQVYQLNQSKADTIQFFPSQRTAQLQIKSKSNQINQQELDYLKKQISEKIGEPKITTMVRNFNSKTRSDRDKNLSSEGQKGRSQFLVKAQKRRVSHYQQQSGLLQKKSQQLAEKNELSHILKKCIQQVKKEVIRRNGIGSLNFFKGNGPMSYIQFTKADHLSILGLLLQNEKVLKKFYQILLQNSN